MVDAKSRVVYDNGTVVYNNTVDEIRGENEDEQNNQQTSSDNGRSQWFEFLVYVIALVVIIMLVFVGYIVYRKNKVDREEGITW